MENKFDKTLFSKSWHDKTVQKTVKFLHADIKSGLKTEQVNERKDIFGLNKLPQKKQLSKFDLFINQFKSPLVYILIIAGFVMLMIGDWTDTLVIFIAVIINAVFGFWEEHKTLNILSKLEKVLKTKAKVKRGEQKIEILQEELVPGDLVFLQAGDRVPADGRLFKVNNLKISEAVLTGEWLPAHKNTEVISKEAHLAERNNMAYAGSLVEAGLGEMVVTAIGKYTETGKIALLVSGVKEGPSPLQIKLRKLGKTLGLLIGGLAIIIFIGGLLRGDNVFEIFEASVAMAVGGVPEALPVVMTIILAIGMERLLRKKGLIRKLSSVETLGSTSIICFDKTKTLTKGDMELAEIISEYKELTLKVSALCNEAFVENPEDSIDKWRIKGSPTDKALLFAGHKEAILKPELEKESHEVAKIPFDPKYKYQLTLREENKSKLLYISGAPEKILEISANKDIKQKDINQLAEKGLRVVGLGYKKVDKDKNEILEEDIEGFTFVGLVGFKDPLRSGIRQAIKVTKQAGLKPIIITGDFSKTAKSIAKEVGIKVMDEEIIEGKVLDDMNDAELEKICSRIKIYARSEPKHKIRIVQAWQKKGEVVAMVGDGVNDSPALKKADIGISLGSGTEVAKEAADLVLLNDSFEIIIKAIEQGRIVLDNLRKSISYVLADSFTSVFIIGFSNIVFGWPIPILPVQILWNNIVEDTLPNIAFAFEPGEEGIMKQGPSPAKVPLLTKEMKMLIFGTGLIDQLLAFGLFWYLWKKLGLDLDYVRTMVFGAICLDTAFVVYSYKSLRKNIWQINLFSNKWLIASSLIVIASFVLAIYFPLLQRVLHTVPIGVGSWFILIIMALAAVVLIEATKWYFIARHKTEEG